MSEQRLNLDCEIFKPLVDEFNVALNALVLMVDKSGKDGELILKLNVKTIQEQKYDKGKVIAEWTEPYFTWDIVRKIKESKNKISSSAGRGFMLKMDEEGKPFIVEVSPQITMFEADGKTNG